MPAEQDYDGQDDVEYETEPRRSRRWLIVAALIGSIGIGGGMAYAYKTMFAPKSSGPTQVVKATRDPVRTAPDNPGGKRFANADNKFMNKLDGESDVDANGVRKVQTVVVGSDRAVVAAPPQAPRPSTVPGMTIVGADSLPGSGAMPQGVAPSMVGAPMAGRPATAQPAPAAGGSARAAVQAVAPQAAPPQRPQVVAKAAPSPAAPSFDSEPAIKQAVPKQAVPKVAAAVAPVAAAKPKAAGGGYVAVLGYQKSQIEAMKTLADLQQKYDVLRDKQLNVIESDQTTRGLGVIYRIVVGPAGSMDAAKGVCGQLIQAGHSARDCYPLQN